MSEADDAFIDYETDRSFGLHPGSLEVRRRAMKLFLSGEEGDLYQDYGDEAEEDYDDE